ncbi:MMPL family transporter [Streptomyces beijiangensis]|uniref:MMPL family transporter n=1 Tax=Streptomyces beijiangensis TaxID=163361 RepID=UPI0027DE94A7|nr:MMPL family transporter [Streptomyces beijiangensis]
MINRRTVLAAALLAALTATLLTTLARDVPEAEQSTLTWWYAACWVLFAAAALALRKVPASHVTALVLAGGIAVALTGLAGPPRTSSDSYRYAWDGRVQAAGISPYDYAPNAPELAKLRDPWLFPAGRPTLINRPSVHTIYPPVAEAYFYAVHQLSPPGARHKPLQVGGVLLATATTAALLLVLRRRKGDPRHAAYWAWCPAVPVEAVNNAHADALGVLLAVVAIGAVVRRKALGGGLLGAAVAVKFLPAVLLPGVLRRRPREVAAVLVPAAAVVALTYLPYVLASRSSVFGYLGGYAQEEGYDDAGARDRYALLRLLLPDSWALPAVIVVMAAVSGLVLFRGDPERPWRGCLLVTGTAFLLMTPGYSWYALLLVARYREELRKHEDRHEAMALALHRAGPAVLASGATVVLGMLVLMAAEMNSTRGLGPVAAIGVAIALLTMLTLFPALLVIFGRWIFWPVKPHYGSPEPTVSGFWARTGDRIALRPRAVWVVTALVLAGLSFGLLQLRADGIGNADAFTGNPDSVVGQKVQAQYFPAGSGDPVVVIANADQADAVRKAVAADPGVVPASIGVPPGSKPVVNGRALFEATTVAAGDSEAAQQTVKRLRHTVHGIPAARAEVGGTTATLIDMNAATRHDNMLIIPLVLLVVLVILGVLLRALVAPLLLIATVVLSFATALGISALVFRYLFDYAGEGTDLPLFVFVFLVALGIDYNIFLSTRIREEAGRQGARKGVVTGLAATGAVITSAGLVLAGTFAVLGTLPMVAFAELGFAVGLGVLLDTFVVRSVLVTSLFLDVGPRVWWPHRLAHDAAALDAAGADRRTEVPSASGSTPQ